ncbi:MAG: hypothetical protein WD649_06165 [Thermoleophilaceae bacterium]
MEAVFGTVVVIIVVIAALAALASYWGSGAVYRQIGKGDLALDETDRPTPPPPASAAATAEAQAEIRQMVEAKSARRVARGEQPLDIEAEIAALNRPPAGEDEALREEVRQLVVARNARRMNRGEEPLEVEAEVDRQLRDLGA